MLSSAEMQEESTEEGGGGGGGGGDRTGRCGGGGPTEAAAAAAATAAAATPACGDGREPSCMDRKYLVAACRSCSRSSAVWRLKKKNIIIPFRKLKPFY